MGVPGLWKIIQPAQSSRSLTEIAVVDGFQNNTELRGYRIGIDTSIWFFHAESGKEGENPHLRTLFFRCCTLMHAPFLPVFVFDGEHRPEYKRGKNINRHKENALTPSVKNMIEAFGYEWRQAPGEAEAELAHLNATHQIDAILSDDVDTFLFGATTVIRNPSPNLPSNQAQPALNSAGKKDPNWARVFTFPHPTLPHLSHAGLILIALLSGGDYHSGLDGCGPKIAYGLAQTPLAQQLFDIGSSSPPISQSRLEEWRNNLRIELKTNASGFLPNKCHSLSQNIPSSFPPISVLMAYINPLTSESYSRILGRPNPHKPLEWTRKDPDLRKIAALCEGRFEWGYKELMIKRFRTLLWPWIALRLIRRAVLHPNVNITGLTLPHGGEANFDQLFKNIFLSASRTRNHASTNNLLEYRVSVDPQQFVSLAESGITGSRVAPEESNQYADGGDFMDAIMKQALGCDDDLDGDESDVGKSKKAKGPAKPPPHPSELFLLWIPAIMADTAHLNVVNEFKERERLKAEKKASKGKGRAKASKDGTAAKSKRTTAIKAKAMPHMSGSEIETDHEEGIVPRPPSQQKTRRLPAVSDEDEDAVPRPPRPKPKLRTKASATVEAPTTRTMKAFYRTTKPALANATTVASKGKSKPANTGTAVLAAQKLFSSDLSDLPPRSTSQSNILSELSQRFPVTSSKLKFDKPSEKQAPRPFPFDENDFFAPEHGRPPVSSYSSEIGGSQRNPVQLSEDDSDVVELINPPSLLQSTEPPLSQTSSFNPSQTLYEGTQSKSKHARTSSNTSEELSHFSGVQKSPRKHKTQTSPPRQAELSYRSASRINGAAPAGRSKYTMVEDIIEISSSESDIDGVHSKRGLSIQPLVLPQTVSARTTSLHDHIIDLT